MKEISKQELYLAERLKRLNIPYETQVKYIYHTFKFREYRGRKYKTYTCDFQIADKVIELKGFSGLEKWNERKPFIYDYLKQQGLTLYTIKSSYREIDKWLAIYYPT